MNDSPVFADEHHNPVARPTFLQRPIVQRMLPVGVSIVFHLAIVGLALLTYQAVQVVLRTPAVNQTIIPESTMVTDEAGTRLKGPPLDANRLPAQDFQPDVPVTSEGWSTSVDHNLAKVLGGGGSGSEQAESMIGIGAAGGIGGRGRSWGPGVSDAKGPGTGDGGPTAPFGVPGGGGGGDASIFSPTIGQQGAHKIVFVCDASGSMMDKFDPLKQELRRAIDRLKLSQAFNVIFFQEGAAATASASGLLMANSNNRNRAYQFLDEASLSANSNPIPGIELAFKQSPELIYLLTDGEFPNNDEVLAVLRKLNAQKQVKINTIAFAEEGQEGEAYVQVLKQIAAENAGAFWFVAGLSALR